MEKTTFLRIFENRDREKVYLLERDGFYELREGKEESFWKSMNIISDRGPEEGTKRDIVSLLGKLTREGISLAPEAVREWKKISFIFQYIEEVPSSFTMDEAIRKWEGWEEKEVKEDEKSFIKTLKEDEGKAYEEAIEALKDIKIPERIPESAFEDLCKWMTTGSYEKVSDSLTGEGKDIPFGTVYATSPGDSEPIFTAKGISKDDLVYVPSDIAEKLSTSIMATGGLKVGGIESGVEVAEPIYAESFLPHLVRAKDEGKRRDIETDTIVIDRGVAVSQGLIREEDGKKTHADVIMGLKVKYAKEGILPMDSAFVIFKEKKAEEKKAEVAEKSDKDAIKDDCRALRTIDEEDLKDMSIDELFTLEENLTHALMTIAHTRKERYSIREDAGEELDMKLSAAFTEAAVAEAKAKAAEREKDEKEDKKAAADAIVEEALEKGGLTFYYGQVIHPVGADVKAERYAKDSSGELKETRIFVSFKNIDKLDMYTKKGKVTEVRVEFSNFGPSKGFPIFLPEGRRVRSFKSDAELDEDDEDERIFEVEVCDKVLMDALVYLQFNHPEVFPWGEGVKKSEADKEKVSEPTPYDLLGSVKIDPALWREGLSSKVKDRTEDRRRAIMRGSVFIPTYKVSGDIPEELIRHRPHAGNIELKFGDVSRIKTVYRERLPGDEKLQQEEWLIYVKVYHEDDLDECILRVASGEVDEMVHLICEQRGLICEAIILHEDVTVREELKIVKTFSPSTGKITMDVEIEDLLSW